MNSINNESSNETIARLGISSPERIDRFMIRVLPYHLRNLAQVGKEVELHVESPVCVATVLDALETAHPVLRGTIREHESHKRRAFLRFFAAGEDISLEPPDQALPASIVDGKEPLMVVGAIAGG